MSKFLDRIEPDTETAQTIAGNGQPRPITFAELMQLSQAISLKRIADALEKQTKAYATNCDGSVCLHTR